jgi:hypothetical protein
MNDIGLVKAESKVVSCENSELKSAFVNLDVN